MTKLQIGDRVELPDIWRIERARGVVEHVDDRHVRVKWDDGQIGLLYFDETMIPKARRLIKLRRS